MLMFNRLMKSADHYAIFYLYKLKKRKINRNLFNLPNIIIIFFTLQNVYSVDFFPFKFSKKRNIIIRKLSINH